MMSCVADWIPTIFSWRTVLMSGTSQRSTTLAISPSHHQSRQSPFCSEPLTFVSNTVRISINAPTGAPCIGLKLVEWRLQQRFHEASPAPCKRRGSRLGFTSPSINVNFPIPLVEQSPLLFRSIDERMTARCGLMYRAGGRSMWRCF
jgi:hypothetical protein